MERFEMMEHQGSGQDRLYYPFNIDSHVPQDHLLRGITPEHLVGDTYYGSAAILGWLVDKKRIEPHFPVWDKTGRDDGNNSPIGRSALDAIQ
jgi:hypothetical protein